jgi:vesicle transport through interaction with t-SNAREs protein 1
LCHHERHGTLPHLVDANTNVRMPRADIDGLFASLPVQKMFDHYEKEYLGTAKKATADIELIDQLLPGVEREATIKRAGEGITAAEEIVQGMEMEARSMTGEAKQQLAAKAKDYKKSIADMRAKLNAAKTSGKAEKSARDELLRSSDPTLRMEADNQRSRLMATNERLNNASDKIRGAVQTALETEKIGESILSDLADQRATIAHARGTLAGTMSGLDKSKKMLQGMGRRALKNKVLMYVVIATLIIMIMFIVYCACAARVPSVPCPF